MIERKLQDRGYRKANEGTADIAVSFFYEIDTGTVRPYTYSTPQTDAFGNIVGSQVHGGSYREYRRMLTIVDEDTRECVAIEGARH